MREMVGWLELILQRYLLILSVSTIWIKLTNLANDFNHQFFISLGFCFCWVFLCLFFLPFLSLQWYMESFLGIASIETIRFVSPHTSIFYPIRSPVYNVSKILPINISIYLSYLSIDISMECPPPPIKSGGGGACPPNPPPSYAHAWHACYTERNTCAAR